MLAAADDTDRRASTSQSAAAKDGATGGGGGGKKARTGSVNGRNKIDTMDGARPDCPGCPHGKKRESNGKAKGGGKLYKATCAVCRRTLRNIKFGAGPVARAVEKEKDVSLNAFDLTAQTKDRCLGNPSCNCKGHRATGVEAGRTILMGAAAKGTVADINTILFDPAFPSNLVHAVDGAGKTALHYAAARTSFKGGLTALLRGHAASTHTAAAAAAEAQRGGSVASVFSAALHSIDGAASGAATTRAPKVRDSAMAALVRTFSNGGFAPIHTAARAGSVSALSELLASRNQFIWVSPRICSRTLTGVGAPHQCSLGTAACALLLMLTRALLMTSSYSEGLRPVDAFGPRQRRFSRHPHCDMGG